MIYPEVKFTTKQGIAFDYLRDDTTQFLLFGGGAGGAKSFLGCLWLVMMCYEYPGSKWFIGRKELKRLMGSTYITLLKVFEYLKIPASDWKLDGKYNVVHIRSSRIDLLDLAYKPTDPLYERLGSLEYTGGWIEEAGEIDFLAFDVLKSRIGRHRNNDYKIKTPKLLITCNPTQNWIYRLFYKPYKENRLPENYKFVQALYRDNPYTASEYGKQLDEISDPILRARLRDGLWEYNADNLTLMSFDSIMATFTNTVAPSPTRYLTADIARFGSDKIVMGVWQGLNLIEVIEKEHQSTTKTEEDIRDVLTSKRIQYNNAIVDEDGVGGGVVDHLYGINGFMGGRSAMEDPANHLKRNYKNLRSQCYFILADKINRHELSITADLTEKQRELIITDLQAIKRVDTQADAPLQIIPKEDIKDSIGRSPDYADMLMMRIYFELNRNNNYFVPNKSAYPSALTDYGGFTY